MEYSKQILDKTNDGLDVFRFFLPVDFKVKKMFKNPFYDDTKASCHIYYEPRIKRYYMKDHGDPTYSGDCFWLVGMLFGINTKTDFMDVVYVINEKMMLGLGLLTPFSVPTQVVKKIEACAALVKPKEEKKRPFKTKTRPMNSNELAFWQKYGITSAVLDRYNVRALESYSTVGDKGPYTIRSSEERMIFGYFGDRFVKVYRPTEKFRFLYGGEKPADYCFGLKQLPTCDDTVFITGGEKDVLSLAAHGFNAVCFNSETGDLPSNIMRLLNERFQHIIIMYDCDETGKKAMEKQVERWEELNLLSLQLPLSGDKKEKDISDFFLLGRTKEELQRLVNEVIATTYADTLALIKACELDLAHPVKDSLCVISVGDTPIASCDNLMCVAGGEGTGKSNFVSSLMAGAMLSEPPSEQLDTLGYSIRYNTDKKAVIHFDTEQTEQQLQKNATMMLSRAGIGDGNVPEFYHPMYFTNLKRDARLRLIKDSMSFFHRKDGGIYMVVIDGIADLVKSANDETDCVKVIEYLYKLANTYHTLMICVLHYVPGGIKLRGHLGSELQRKAATILSVEKDDDPNFSVVKVMKLRDGNPLDVPMQQFSWDKEKNMFVFRGSKSEAAMANRKKIQLDQLVMAVFADGNGAYTYTELTERIMEEADVKDRTAKEYIKNLYKNKTIIKQGDKYIFNRSNLQSHEQ